MESRAVLVANLSDNSKQHEIIKIFAHCGKILTTKVHKAKQQPCYAIKIIFSTITEARIALQLNGRQINGRPLLVRSLVDYAPSYARNANHIFYKPRS